MKCKCDSEMTMLAPGIWICTTYDYFAVTIMSPPGIGDVQWYTKAGDLEYSDSFDELTLSAFPTKRGRIMMKSIMEAERR